jgi:hypothetical protein
MPNFTRTVTEYALNTANNSFNGQNSWAFPRYSLVDMPGLPRCKFGRYVVHVHIVSFAASVTRVYYIGRPIAD